MSWMQIFLVHVAHDLIFSRSKKLKIQVQIDRGIV